MAVEVCGALCLAESPSRWSDLTEHRSCSYRLPQPELQSTTFSCNRMLVTLDGNPDHEEGLRVASSLAKICEAELYLIMAVHTFNTLSGEQAATAKILPAATQALLDLAEQDAKEYLHRHITTLKAEGSRQRPTSVAATPP